MEARKKNLMQSNLPQQLQKCIRRSSRSLVMHINDMVSCMPCKTPTSTVAVTRQPSSGKEQKVSFAQQAKAKCGAARKRGAKTDAGEAQRITRSSEIWILGDLGKSTFLHARTANVYELYDSTSFLKSFDDHLHRQNLLPLPFL